MSVLAYIYPRELKCVAFDPLLDSLKQHLSGCVVEQREKKPRAIPDWSYLLISTDEFEHLRFELVVAKNSKANIDWIAERHGSNRNLDVVRDAKKYVWCKIKAGDASERELIAGFTTFNLVVSTLARISNGVIDLPENGKL